MSRFDGTYQDTTNIVNTDKYISVEVLQDRVVTISEPMAIEIAFAICADYAADHTEKDIARINITKPSDDKYETDCFHMFLALTDELSVRKSAVETALSSNEPKSYPDLYLHTSIAQERVASDKLITGLSNTYDVIKGRFRREVREYEYKKKIEADIQLIKAVQDGDEDSLEYIFNRNGDMIINDLLRHGHDAPNEIIDLAQEAVRKLVESSSPDELADFGLDLAIRGTVQNLIFEMIPIYREEVDKEQREKAIKFAVGNLKVAEYVAKLISFEEQAESEAKEFIEPAPFKFDKQQAAILVKASIDHLRLRADNEINPGIEVLNRVTNQDKRIKRYKDLRDEFRTVFRKHIAFSLQMKQIGLESFDIYDIYEYTDQGHTRKWSSFLNQIIDISTEAK